MFLSAVESRRGAAALDSAYLFPPLFVWRCLSGAVMAPFPRLAHRTGHAAPHPALGQDVRSSRLGGYVLSAAVLRGLAYRGGTRTGSVWFPCWQPCASCIATGVAGVRCSDRSCGMLC